MTDPKNTPVNDSEFDRDIAAASRAYRQADTDLPPPMMDDAIRAAARRAVKSQPHAVDKSWVSRWTAPLSAAALVVLSVSVGFVALQERPELAPAVVSELVIVRPAEKMASVAPIAAPESPAPAKMKAPQATPSTPTAEKKVLAENRAVAQDRLVQSNMMDFARKRNEQDVGAPAALAKDLSLAEATVRASIIPAPALAAPAVVATAPAAAPAPFPATERQAFVADPATGATARKEIIASSESVKKEMALDQRASGQIAGVSGTSRSDAAMSAQKVQAKTPASAPAAPAITSRTTSAPPINAPAAAAAVAMADSLGEPPEAWIKRILELKKQGKTRDVEDELAKFRKRYPDYLLPDELKPQK